MLEFAVHFEAVWKPCIDLSICILNELFMSYFLQSFHTFTLNQRGMGGGPNSYCPQTNRFSDAAHHRHQTGHFSKEITWKDCRFVIIKIYLSCKNDRMERNVCRFCTNSVQNPWYSTIFFSPQNPRCYNVVLLSRLDPESPDLKPIDSLLIEFMWPIPSSWG